MNLMKTSRALAAIAFATLGFAFPAQAAITTFFSTTANCLGTATAPFATSGAAVQVSLCATTTAPTATCGHTIVLQSAAAESGRFNVTARALGPNYPDANSEVILTPLAINNPAATADFGGTVAVTTPIAATANQLLATFDITPQATATANSYVISLAPASAAAVDADGLCGATTVPTDAPLTASFTLTRVLTPTFTSAAATTFAAGVANTFNVTASGSTPITFSATGLPATVTLSSAGVLSGTPTAGSGPFNVTITATNGSGSATQNFVLSVSGQATQTISFTGPASQTFSATTIPLTATASSGLPVSFIPTTPAVCTVLGSNVTMVSLGTCTINANQAGNATFLAAPTVTRSFGITATVPGAPTIGAAIAGNAQATIAFSTPAPYSNGGSPITGYTVTCTAGASSVSAGGTISPITVNGLTNSVAYSCLATATNSFGTSIPSGTVAVTPSASAPLTLIGVRSRKVHGGAGTFDLPIATSAPITVEPRAIGTGYNIVFQFNTPVTVAGTATATDAVTSLPIGTVAAPTAAGSEVVVVLTGIADNKRVTVTISGVNSTFNQAVTIGFLNGEVDNTFAVDSTDILIVKRRSGQAVDPTNFLYDLDSSGAIDSTDIIIVKRRSGLTLP